MIDRKALWISLFLVCAMIAAILWRLSLLPDWHHVPADGPGGSRTIPVFMIFAGPLAVLFSVAVLYVRKWLRSGPEEAMQHWRRSNGLILMFNAVMMALMQAFILARSLGALQSVDRLAVSHAAFLVSGIFLMVAGNALPKAPWLSMRFRPLDPWQWNRHLRFGGKLMVGMGLFMAVGMPLLPEKMVPPVTIGLMLTMLAAGFWHRAWVKREPSPLA